MNIHELKEQRASKISEMRAIAAKAESEKRDLAEGELRQFDTLKTASVKLDGDISRAEYLNEAERRMEGEPISQRGGDSMHTLECRFKVGKALAEHMSGKLSGVEAEYAAENRSGRKDSITMPVSVFLGSAESRALTSTLPAAGPGSNLIQTSLGPIIDRLRPLLAVESMGATVLPGLTDNLDLPRVKASGTASWNGEHANATGSDAQFDKVSMIPRTVSALYEISRRMLLQASNLETILRGDIGYLLAQALDGAAIVGGTANAPTGIIATAAVPVVSLGANGLAPTIDMAADMIGSIADNNAIGNTGFLTNSKVRKAAMKLKDSQLRPYGIPEFFKNEPVMFSNQVPSNLTKGSGTNLSAAVYGVWSDLVIGYWSSVDIVLNPYADSVASKGGALLHAFLDADVALRHPESFVVCKDIIA
jgi:HK97 family phage major capsid protein